LLVCLGQAAAGGDGFVERDRRDDDHGFVAKIAPHHLPPLPYPMLKVSETLILLELGQRRQRNRRGFGGSRTHFAPLAGLYPVTPKTVNGRLKPRKVTSSTRSATTTSSVADMTRWVIRICPALASEQSRAAKLVTLPM